MRKKRFCFTKKCAECGKKIGFFRGYRHPILGKKKCVCRTCWDKIDKSESEYNKFIHNTLCKDKHGVPCFVIINTKPKYEKVVYNSLKKFPEIKELHPLLGKHDLLAKIEIESYDKLGSFVINKIRPVRGIKNTRTLTGAFSLRSS